MIKYLLDTNICIYIMNKRPIEIIERFRQFDVGEIGISTVTVSELYYGAAKSKNRRLNRQRLEEFLSPLSVVPYDVSAAVCYGEIRSVLERRGELIGPLDTLIAAHALSANFVLITNNVKEFKRVNKLKVVNWAK